MSIELWDLYTENRELTGRTHIRGENIPDGLYHLVVHVWIRNSRGEYLISQRSANRPTFPLMWECQGGSCIMGEDSLKASLREVKEEVGVELCPDNGRVVYSKIRKKMHDIMDVWLFDYDGEVSLDNATTDEVAQVRWLTVEKIKNMFEAGMLVQTLEYFFTQIA